MRTGLTALNFRELEILSVTVTIFRDPSGGMDDEFQAAEDLFVGWTLTPDALDNSNTAVWRVGMEHADGNWAGSWHFGTADAGKEYVERHFDIEPEEWERTYATPAEKVVWRVPVDESSDAVVAEIPVFDSPDDIR